MLKALSSRLFSPLAPNSSKCSSLRALNTGFVLPQVPHLASNTSQARPRSYACKDMLDIYGGKGMVLAWQARKTVKEPLQKEACADPAGQQTCDSDTNSVDQTSSWGPAGQSMPIPNTHIVVEVGPTKHLMSKDGTKIRIPKELVPKGVAVGDRLQYQVQADTGSNQSNIKRCVHPMVTRHLQLRSADNTRISYSYRLVDRFPAAVCAERGPRVSTCAELQAARKHAACASADSF